MDFQPSSYVPIEARCRYCILSFCCKCCRLKHEKTDHQSELDKKATKEYLQSICYMCHGSSFPYNPNEKIADDLLDHIVQNHFPLKCDKCLKIFETVADIEQIGKCCKKPIDTVSEQKEEIITRNASRKRPSELKADNYDEDVLTPLTKINLHWRRKSKEFSLLKGIEEPETKQQTAAIIRSTSTPVLLQNTGSDSTSSLQYSSIRYSSSCDTDLSPPSNNQQQAPPIPTPKSVKKNMSQNKKLYVQNTPFRQLMTKSIQKSIATHGHYQNINLQQRKMSFDSSSSGSEKTVSLMKLDDSNDGFQPLDLRTSPVIKREHCESKTVQKLQEAQYKNVNLNDGSGRSKNVEIKIEEIQVIYQTEKSSLVTNYRSCYSESVTPKIVGNNFLKKTISFESPKTLEKTPSFLLPMRTSRRSYSQDDNKNNNTSIDDTVFYTPKTTPARSTIERRLSTPEMSLQKTAAKQAPVLNIWKYMTSVVGNLVGGAAVKDLEETNSLTPLSENESKWTNVLQKPLKAAAEYFVRTSSQIDDDEDEYLPAAQKRRHSDDTKSGSSSAIAAGALSPIPSFKRRRIQGRKPIRRLQSDS